MFNEKEIQDLKELHGDLYHISSTDDNGTEAHFLVKKPTMRVVAMGAKVSEADSIEGGRKMLINCIVRGDIALIKDNVQLFTGVMEQFGKLMKATTSDIKKL